MAGQAVFSDCRRYRYRLERKVRDSGPVIAFLLHNPSTADEERDDAALRRGIGFVRRWGGSCLMYVNPWAWIATKPKDLWSITDPIGPANDWHIREVAAAVVESGGFMVFAWGAIKPPASRRLEAEARLLAVADLVRASGCHARTLGTNADGSPKHPLYVQSDSPLQAWIEAHMRHSSNGMS